MYEAADFELVDKPYARSTYVCDLAAIPVADDRFDAVIFNQTMEHLSDPLAVLKELRRVMKPGARALCTAPLFYEEHEQPYDFYRYTQFGWRDLMAKAGLEIESLDWMEGYFGTVAYQLDTAARYLPTRPAGAAKSWRGALTPLIMIIVKRLFAALSRMFSRIDVRSKHTVSGYPKNYVVIVRKP